jgi:hypothetical protein
VDVKTFSDDAKRKKASRKKAVDDGLCPTCKEHPAEPGTQCLQCVLGESAYANLVAGDVDTVMSRPRLRSRTDVQIGFGLPASKKWK